MALYQHRFNGITQLGTRWTNTWWSDTASSLTAVHSAAVTWANSFYGGIVTLMAADVGLTDVQTGEIDQSNGRQLQVQASAAEISGTAVGNSLPTDCAIVVSLRTLLANRRGRGRFYLPPFVADIILTDDGRVTPTGQSTITGELTTAWSNYVATGTPVVYSRTGRTTQPITSYDVGDLFDTQRGRQDRIVENRLSAPMP